MRLLPDLSRGAEDQGWDGGGQSAGDERESRPFQLGSSHPGTNLGRETGTVHTLSPPGSAPPASGPEAPPSTTDTSLSCRSLTGSRVGGPVGCA